jgi:DnaJ-class molecular chaperone
MLLKLKGISQKRTQYHPENPGDKSAEEKFKLAAEAYEFKRSSEKSQIRSIRSSL